MSYHSVLVIFIEITSLYAAPLQLFLPPLGQVPVSSPEVLMNPTQLSQQDLLQQQLLALQQMQNLEKLNTFNTPLTLNVPQAVPMFLLPNTLMKSDHKSNEQKENNEDNQKNDIKHAYEHTDEDSVIIDAEPLAVETQSQKAILLIPNGGKFSIGGIISAIPFLPIEINVPDTISWAYNGISSIISGIGQRLPFRPRPPQSTMQPQNLKLLLKQLQKNQNSATNLPLLVIPMNVPMLPI